MILGGEDSQIFHYKESSGIYSGGTQDPNLLRMQRTYNSVRFRDFNFHSLPDQSPQRMLHQDDTESQGMFKDRKTLDQIYGSLPRIYL